MSSPTTSTAAAAWSSPSRRSSPAGILQGRFLTGGYSPFPPGGGPIGGSTLGSFDATHPIMAGVTAAQGNLLGDVQLSSGSELVASWLNGEPLAATKGHVAAINIFVAASGYWSGDIPLILHNAAFWSAGGARHG